MCINGSAKASLEPPERQQLVGAGRAPSKAREPEPDGNELVELGWFSRDALPEPLMHSSAVAIRHYAAYRETGAFQVG